MPQANVFFKGITLNSARTQPQAIYDIVTDWQNPSGGGCLVLNDLTVNIVSKSSTTQINSAIRAAVVPALAAQGFPNTGITTNDVVLFGGAI